MSQNLNSFFSKLTLNTTKRTFQDYFEYLLPFLEKPKGEQISYIAFHNYFSLCSFLSSKIYQFFTRIREPQLKTINKEVCLEGFELLFFSDFKTRARMAFKLFDFDNDGYINIDDAKLLFSHFHYLTNKTEISKVYEVIEDFFNFFQDKNKQMDLVTFLEIITKQNSDFIFLFFFYLFENKPFQEQEFSYYENMVQSNKSKGLLLSSEELHDGSDNFDSEFAEPSEWIFDYLNANYKIGLDYYLSPLLYDENEDEKDLND